jgi:hypothetical protein
MSTKHTPGPWREYDPHFLGVAVAADGEQPNSSRIIADVSGGREATEEECANARLIAAAPDLKDSLRFARAELVRLQGVVDAVNSSLISDVLRDIDESLAKAEGKS